MERLTYRDKYGYAMMAPEHEEQHSTQEWIDMLENRLAAYEDTGLEPEEVEDLASVREISPEAEYAINKHADSIIQRLDALLHKDDGPVLDDRLRELAQADREGRVVVLPVKTGTKVFHISRRLNGNHEIEERYFNLTYNCPEDFGKTLFITREEAEKALGGGVDG